MAANHNQQSAVNKAISIQHLSAVAFSVPPCLRVGFISDFLLRQLPAQQLFQPRSRAAHAQIKSPEQCIHGAYLIKAHLVDQLLEDQWIIREQVYAPLPIVKADRSRDDLPDGPGVTTTDQPMLFHLALALFNGQAVPVLVFAASAVHGIEADIAVRRNLREQPRTHRLGLALDRLFDYLIPLR